MFKAKWRRLAAIASAGTIIVGGSIVAAPVAQAATQPVYVALGDSFAAGPGSGFNVTDRSVYAAGTSDDGNQCYRASSAYPTIVAKNKGYTLINATCSGAVTDNILNDWNRPIADRTVLIPAQIKSVPANASIVSLTIGGNDAGFADFVTCVSGADHAIPLSPDPECTTNDSRAQFTVNAINSLAPKVTAVIEAIKEKAPNARIIVTGYPQLVNDVDQFQAGCTPWLTGGEPALSNSVNKSLNTVISNVASAEGALYVNQYRKAPYITNACTLAPNRQINGLTLSFQAGALHPNNQGQAASASLVSAAIG